MEWSHQTVLVTGAAGFIGSHLVERMVELGGRTRALVRYSSTGSWGWLDHSPVKDDVEIMPGDIRDPTCVAEAFRGIDIVFHLAALIGIPYSYSAPHSYVRTNVEGTLNVLQSARDGDVTMVVHTSTSEVYGTARKVPITEDHPLQGQSPYSATKIAADKLAESFHLSFGLPVAIVRPFNTYGPRQSARAIIPTIISQLLSDSTVKLGNVLPTRDFNFVTDTVEGFVKVAGSTAAVGQAINIGSGKEISIGDLAELLASLLGKSIQVVTDEQRLRPDNSEVERLLADNTKAKELAGWTPSVDLSEGLRRTIAWITENRHIYRSNLYQV